MFSSSQFEDSSPLAGGGFMSSQLGGSTPSSARIRDMQGLVPATVKQISEASQSGGEKSSFIIDGVDVANVTVVGMVFNKNSRSSDIRFHLDDGTGRIECIRWVTERLDTGDLDALEDGTYVRVNGHLQTFQSKRQLNAFSVRLVTNFDEVTCHYLECIHFHLQNSKVQSKADEGSVLASQAPDSSFSTPVRGASNGHNPTSTNDFSMQYNADGLKSFDKLVLNYLQQPSNIDREMGIHVDELSQQLKSPLEKIKDAIEFLEREGLVYSSIDDYHYKAVEGL
ncbi:replication protein A 32 kDa subunit A-like isoform X1 [Gossypium australe]|uniref:Replication protein A 32 kDa subunit A-like isoform X1 n=1 Tax=Gossypium australe TaxID=47621 RepID=A0A5B6WXU2_9ROSI|nr:replication protein A 32 kDa subunit A-like isoform X1 [Gossypium australe]